VTAHEERRGEALRTMRHDGPLIAFLVAGLATGFVYLQMTSGLALHAHASGLSSADFGLLMALNGIVITCCELPLPRPRGRGGARARARPAPAPGGGGAGTTGGARRRVMRGTPGDPRYPLASRP
jgi:hypothetical protein